MINFAVFHTGPETVEKYLPLMRIGKRELERTNPGARYIIITDKATAPCFDKEFEVAPIAPKDMPLMPQYVAAQYLFVQGIKGGTTILADSDCIPNRNLHGSLRHQLAITYRNRSRTKINNVAYVKDHDLAAWFLHRSLEIMDPTKLEWWGDQEAWERALGPADKWEEVDGFGFKDVLEAKPDGKRINLYPCRTHNFFTKNWEFGIEKAYLLHFKGQSKSKIEQFYNNNGRKRLQS